MASSTPRLWSMRYSGVDGLRGIASLAVLNFHLLNQVSDGTVEAPVWFRSSVAALAESPLGIFFNGPLAVHFFFFLSGFALFAGYKWEPQRIHRWYLARFTRLYLPVWPALLLALLVAILKSPHAGAAGQPSVFSEPFGILKSATLIAGVGIALPALWSLTWEVWFSFSLPFLKRFWPHNVNFWLASIGLTVVMITGDLLQVGVLRYGPMFVLGALVQAKWDDFVRLFNVLNLSIAKRLILGFLTPALILSAPIFLDARVSGFDFGLTFSSLAYPIEFLAFSLILVVGVAAPTSDVGFLTKKLIQLLGKISFSLYLVHQSILTLVKGAEISWGNTLLVGFILSILLAFAFYKVVESPSHNLSRAIGGSLKTFRKP
jgi:peptidoglycan/LPS O-acetylase OafA/YrhL